MKRRQSAKLSFSNAKSAGVIRGDPLDIVLFEETGWTLTEPQQEEAAQYDQLAPTVLSSPPTEPDGEVVVS